MGLSIHYSGLLRDKKLLGPLIEEVKEISETLDWTPYIIDDKGLKNMRKHSILFRNPCRILLLCPAKPPLRWLKELRKF